MIGEYSTIVGLLSAFMSGRDAKKALDIAEFLQWLAEHNHQEIKHLVEQNHTTVISIKALLNNDLGDIKEALDDISRQIAILSINSDDLGVLAKEYAPEFLSDQAMEILSLMDQHESQYFLLSREVGDGKRLILAPGPNYLCKEPRFLQDDLETMLSLSLLRKDYNANGESLFYITRLASSLVNGRNEAS